MTQIEWSHDDKQRSTLVRPYALRLTPYALRLTPYALFMTQVEWSHDDKQRSTIVNLLPDGRYFFSLLSFGVVA